MNPRPRRHDNKDLPPNLYKDGKGYKYRNPVTGKWKRLVGDKLEIINADVAANNALMRPRINLIDDMLFCDLLDDFKKEFLPDRRLAKTTMAEHGRRLAQYMQSWRNDTVSAFTVFKISEFLKDLPQSTYIKHRGLLIDIFKYAISRGLISHNPAIQTLVRKAEPRKRKRWAKGQFFKMRALAEPWLKVALDLAVVTLQRRDDLINMKFEDVNDGYLYVKQGKTSKRLAVQMGDDLKKLVSRARKSGIASPYILHRLPNNLTTRQRSTKTHWSAINGDYLTKAVAKLRDSSGVCDDLEPRERPTLHELRSLGAYFYEMENYDRDYIQLLLGHDTKAMTEHYLDGHKVRWQSVSAGLDLDKLQRNQK